MRACRGPRATARGFTLVEVLVALMVVAMGMAALMVAVSGAARTSGYLRDKTLAEWIAMNRLTEVRLNAYDKFAKNTDTAEVTFAGRTWHYDTRYFDTSIGTMRRIVVRVYLGNLKAKGNPLAESTGFHGTAVNGGGASNAEWFKLSAAPTGLDPSTTGTNPGTTPSSGAASGSSVTAPTTPPTRTNTP